MNSFPCRTNSAESKPNGKLGHRQWLPFEMVTYEEQTKPKTAKKSSKRAFRIANRISLRKQMVIIDANPKNRLSTQYLVITSWSHHTDIFCSEFYDLWEAIPTSKAHCVCKPSKKMPLVQVKNANPESSNKFMTSCFPGVGLPNLISKDAVGIPFAFIHLLTQASPLNTSTNP